MEAIYRLGDDPVVVFAAREFAKYARKVASVSLPIKRRVRYDPDAPGIWIGVCSNLSHEGWPKLEESKLDDGYAVLRSKGQLLIAGANGRSALFGVYRYFWELGARWVRPGPSGEVLPSLDGLPEDPLDIVEHPSYRHRGICIEGAPSLEHTIGIIDWMAKRRMNTFFLQFQHSGTFWERWYSREYNPYFGKPKALSEDDFCALDEEVIGEVKKRGLILHRVGHGWTAAAVGMPCIGWEKTDIEVPESKRRWLAEVDGRRELHDDIPVNTELCYSYGPAFEALLDEVISYAREHPESDVIHFWLSDAMNNKCECPDCRELSPPDWYAKLVNALSAKLHTLDPERRFVFLSYFESWWPPEHEIIDSKYGNVILMFAPISRCFRHALTDNRCSDGFDLDRPKLNKAESPRFNREFIELFGKWWHVHSGDSFLFDYHLWSGVHSQASDGKLADVLHQDIRDLGELGINGIVNCQVLRIFWPTGLPMAATAETLWNRDISWEYIMKEHLRSSFGSDAPWAENYLTELEELLIGGPGHEKPLTLDSGDVRRIGMLRKFLKEKQPEIPLKLRLASNNVQRTSLRLLSHQNHFLMMACEALEDKARGDTGKFRSKLDRLEGWLLKSERLVHPYLDISILSSRWISRLRRT